MIGVTVSYYRIVEKLGSGGMGVVYKAVDTRLGRSVALKFLSDKYAKDRLALERFQREARVVASLDHHNICAIYDIGEYQGQHFIVMQLLEGETLSQRIARKSLQISDVIDIGIEIADALEKAHLKRIIHRDLKPGNIFITNDGHAKVLDFGLAKLTPDNAAVSAVVTEGSALTDHGVALGTIAYMSPEQTQGRELDQRTDLFSFGAVLYEMATGHRAFAGATNAMIFDAVLRGSPTPPIRLNPLIPLKLEELVLKALEKDRETRYQSAAELRADLKRLKRETESVQVIAPTVKLSQPRRRMLWAALAVVVASAVVIGLILTASLDSPGIVPGDFRSRLLLSSAQTITSPMLSADGKNIAYVTQDQGRTDIFVSRAAGGGSVRVTNDSATEFSPRFSPDGENIIFVRVDPTRQEAEIFTTPTFGGPIVPIIGGADPAWSPDGKRIAFIQRKEGAQSLAIADANGQNVKILLEADSTFMTLVAPAWSPDGSQLAVVRSMGGVTGEIWTVAATGGEARRVSQDRPEVFSHEPVFTPDGRGIVHSSNRGGATNIWLSYLDGTPPVRLTTGSGPDEYPSIARDGTIAYFNDRYRWVLLLSDLQSGSERELLSHSWYLWAPVISPDGDEVAVSRSEPDGSWHIWTVPISGGRPQRLTSGTLPEIYPRFTPDGKFILYHTWSAQPDRIWRILRTGGIPSPITPDRKEDDSYADISPDGRRLAFARTEGEKTRVYISNIDAADARLLTQSPSTVPSWSPDGKWIAFSPDRSDAAGVFVISADGSGERRLTETGSWPIWWPDGSRIAYRITTSEGNQQVRTVPFVGGSATVLSQFKFNGVNYPFTLTPNGQLATTNSIHLASEIWLLEPK